VQTGALAAKEIAHFCVTLGFTAAKRKDEFLLLWHR
jgi:hypothetical protein